MITAEDFYKMKSELQSSKVIIGFLVKKLGGEARIHRGELIDASAVITTFDDHESGDFVITVKDK